MDALHALFFLEFGQCYCVPCARAYYMLAAENLSIEKSLLFVAFRVRVSEYSSVGYSCDLIAASLVEE